MTRLQLKILAFVRDFTVRTGKPPLASEIAAQFGVIVKTARYHLRNLELAGAIRWRNGKLVLLVDDTLELVAEPNRPPVRLTSYRPVDPTPGEIAEAARRIREGRP